MALFGFKDFNSSTYFVRSATFWSSSPTALHVNYTKDRVRALSRIGKLILLLFFSFYEYAVGFLAVVFVQLAVESFKVTSPERIALGIGFLLFVVLLAAVFCRAVPRLLFALKVLLEPRLKKRLPKRSFWG